MRVISGKYRGRKLVSPIGDDVRPTADKVKESVFNVIQFDVAGSRFLDLFCGSGSIGLEALSRGAKSVLFADSSKASLELAKTNLKGVTEDFKLMRADFRDTLYSASGKWDFIFADPPYKSDYIEEICSIVLERGLLADGGYIIYEHSDKQYKLHEGLYIAKRKSFGAITTDYIAVSRGKAALAGSYDPITKGHIDVLDKALESFDEAVVLIACNPDKTYTFSLSQRVEFAKLAVKDYLNVSVDVCDGYVYEYCQKHNIRALFRGYRNETDLAYEKDMAQFNLRRGLHTELVEGTREISSSLIREKLKVGEDVKKYLPTAETARAVVKAYKERL